MKTLNFAGIFLVLLTACQSTVVDKQKSEIKYKETVVLHEVPKATLTFFEVSDSRCPKDVQCVWAGNATVDLALAGVTSEGRVENHITMCLGACGKNFKTADSLIYEFTGEKYLFVLNAVNPQPLKDSTNAKENYSISLKIEKQ